MSRHFSIFSCPYLDINQQCYTNIVTINCVPSGPLNNIVCRVKFNKLSPFKQPTGCNRVETCGLSILSLKGRCKNVYMTVDELPDLFTFLLNNGYNINTQLSKIFEKNNIEISNEKKIIAFVSYK